MLHKIIDQDLIQRKDGNAKGDNLGNKVADIQWHNYIFPIMLTYNNKNDHTATNMTPNEATQEDNTMEAKLSMLLKAKRNGKYPQLNIKDRVKIMFKYDKFRKEHNPIFSDLRYEIEKIEEKHGLKIYMVNGWYRLRNELIEV